MAKTSSIAVRVTPEEAIAIKEYAAANKTSLNALFVGLAKFALHKQPVIESLSKRIPSDQIVVAPMHRLIALEELTLEQKQKYNRESLEGRKTA